MIAFGLPLLVSTLSQFFLFTGYFIYLLIIGEEDFLDHSDKYVEKNAEKHLPLTGIATKMKPGSQV